MAHCQRCGHALCWPYEADPFSAPVARCRLCVVLDRLRQAILQLEPRTTIVGLLLTGLELLLAIVLSINVYVVEATASRAQRQGEDTDSDDEVLRRAHLP